MEISSIVTDHRRAVAWTDGGPRKAVAQVASQAAARMASHRPQGRSAANNVQSSQVTARPPRTNAHRTEEPFAHRPG